MNKYLSLQPMLQYFSLAEVEKCWSEGLPNAPLYPESRYISLFTYCFGLAALFGFLSYLSVVHVVYIYSTYVETIYISTHPCVPGALIFYPIPITTKLCDLIPTRMWCLPIHEVL